MLNPPSLVSFSLCLRCTLCSRVDHECLDQEVTHRHWVPQAHSILVRLKGRQPLSRGCMVSIFFKSFGMDQVTCVGFFLYIYIVKYIHSSLLQLRSHSLITLDPSIILSPPAPPQAASHPLNTPPPVQDRYIHLPVNSNYRPITQSFVTKFIHSEEPHKFLMPLLIILNMFCFTVCLFLVRSVWSSASVFVSLWAAVSSHTP